jgi:hypothetical protein
VATYENVVQLNLSYSCWIFYEITKNIFILNLFPHRFTFNLQGGLNMTGTDAACLHTNQSRSYLNHLVYWNKTQHKRFTKIFEKWIQYQHWLYCVYLIVWIETESLSFLQRWSRRLQCFEMWRYAVCRVVYKENVIISGSSIPERNTHPVTQHQFHMTFHGVRENFELLLQKCLKTL